MKKSMLCLGLALGLTAGWTATASDSGALVDALVRKGILTSQEGEEIRADLLADHVQTPGGKLNIATHVRVLRLYGDARFRYQNDTISTLANPTAANADLRPSRQRSRDRYRYRLRIGADYTFTEGFKAGVRFATTGAANSTNNTFADGYAKDGLFIDRVFLDWTPEFSWIPQDVTVNLVGGKTGPLFFLDGINLDSDINFTGTSQKISYSGISDFDLSLVTAQYLYNASLIDNFILGSAGTTAVSGPITQVTRQETRGIDGTWQIVVQPAMTYTWEKDHSVMIAPMWLYNVNGQNENRLFQGARANVVNAGSGLVDIGNINVVYLPVEVRWKAWDQSFRFYYTYSHNFASGNRDRTLRSVTGSSSNMGDASDSHLVGLAIGSTRKKGGWQVDGFYAYRELYSADPGWVDSDWNQAGMNGRGFGIRTGYAFTDFLVGNVTYLYGEKISEMRDSLPNNASAAASNRNSVLQVDLSYRF